MFRYSCLLALTLATLCHSNTTVTTKQAAQSGDGVQVFEIFNVNPLPMRIFEIGFSEFLNDQLLTEQFVRSPPIIDAYKQSETFSFKVKDVNNTEVSQRWTAVVGYDNNTYVTREFVRSKYVPDALGLPTKVILDMKQDNFVISSPESKNVTVKLAAANRTLIDFTKPSELIEEMAKLKKEMDAVFAKQTVPLL